MFKLTKEDVDQAVDGCEVCDNKDSCDINKVAEKFYFRLYGKNPKDDEEKEGEL